MTSINLNQLCAPWFRTQTNSRVNAQYINLDNLKLTVVKHPGPQLVISNPRSTMLGRTHSVKIFYGEDVEDTCSDVRVDPQASNNQILTITSGLIPGVNKGVTVQISEEKSILINPGKQRVVSQVKGRGAAAVEKSRPKNLLWPDTKTPVATITSSSDSYYTCRFTCCLRLSGQVLHGWPVDQGNIIQIVRDRQAANDPNAMMFSVDSTGVTWRVEGQLQTPGVGSYDVQWS